MPFGHEEFLKKCACNTSNQLQNQELKNYLKELEAKHETLFNQFFDLL